MKSIEQTMHIGAHAVGAEFIFGLKNPVYKELISGPICSSIADQWGLTVNNMLFPKLDAKIMQ